MKISRDLINVFLYQKKYFNYKMFFLILVSELSSIAIIALIGFRTSEIAVKKIDFTYFALFCLTIVISCIASTIYSNRMSTITGTLTNDLRKKLTSKVKECDLYMYENLGQSVILSRITKDVSSISSALPIAIGLVQSLILAIFCFGYMLYLSALAFLIFAVFITSGYVLYNYYNKISYKYWNEALQKEVLLFDALAHILNGFKEIKLNSQKKEEIYDIFSNVSNDVFDNTLKSWKIYNTNDNFFYLIIYFAVGLILFILPAVTNSDTSDSIKLLALIIYTLNPTWSIISTIPTIGQLDTTLKLIRELEKKLDESCELVSVSDNNEIKKIPDFQKIKLENVSFHYVEKNFPAFKVGPLSLTINKGDMLFITGGNGSGKSTLVKLITSLYRLETGTIFVDDVQITKDLIQPYRELFGAIFYDFRLFDRLYGVEKVDEDRLRYLLKMMKIDDKIEYIDQKFTTINLSTGQRKRLALVASLMENRPIYVLDEWAAEQDPHFHHYYYQILLPELKKEGKTLIVISHDDRYFGTADRLIKMEYGQIISIT